MSEVWLLPLEPDMQRTHFMKDKHITRSEAKPLEMPLDQSHTIYNFDAHFIAIVKLLARQAAEEDYALWRKSREDKL